MKISEDWLKKMADKEANQPISVGGWVSRLGELADDLAAYWTPTEDRLPERGQKVDWISPGGEQVNGGTFQGGAVWFPPNSEMYVYYTPVFWRPAVQPTDDQRAK